MPRKFKFCLHCRRTIAENEIQRGLFVQTPQGMLCATCAQQLDEETEAAKKLTAAQTPVPADPPAPAVEEEPPPAPVPPPAPPRPEPAPPKAPSREPEPVKAPAVAAANPPSVELVGASPPAPADPHFEHPAQLLVGIRQHLEAIHRTLVFEKSSPWNVLAAVAQCLAVGMLVIAAFNWADNPMPLLLVALIFQVMALTFFVRGK